MVLSGICACQPRLQTSHRPDGKVADALASTLACTTAANASVIFSKYVPQRTLKTSHRPHGKMADMPKSTLIFQFGSLFGSIRDLYVPATPANFPSPRWDFHMFCFVLVLAGWRCLHRWWHGDLVIMHHHWQQSLFCACTRSKVPIAPMGKMLTRLF